MGCKYSYSNEPLYSGSISWRENSRRQSVNNILSGLKTDLIRYRPGFDRLVAVVTAQLRPAARDPAHC
jgi:hypothetical protein